MTVTTKAALAAELGITKARVSQYVKAGMPVRDDGKLNREESLDWITASHADDRKKRHAGVKRANDIVRGKPPARPLRPAMAALAGARSDILVESMLDRVENWREIHVDDPDERTLSRIGLHVLATEMGVPRDAVLTWLRAGCPYLTEGDWSSGDAFEVDLLHVVEWTSLVIGRLAASRNDEAMRALRLAPLLRERPVHG